MPTGTNHWGNTQWGASTIVAGSGLVLDTVNAYVDVIYRLGFTGPRDVVSTSWVTAAELYQFADEAAKQLSYLSGVFVTYDNSTAVLLGTALYSLPAAHVFTLAAGLIYAGSRQLLRITSAAELWALDALWSAATGSPLRVSMDAGGANTATLYPKPIANATLGLICEVFPGTVTASSSTLPLPTPLQDYFSYRMLLGARSKESENAMLDMAGHFRERCKMYEAIMLAYYGRGQ